MNETGEVRAEKGRGLRRLQYNAPAVLTFALLALAALLLGYATGGAATRLLFSVYRSPFTDPLTYARLFGHTLGHAGFAHFSGNFTIILIAGPMLEEKYGTKNMALMIAATALITGLLQLALSPNSIAYGASGVVFMLIVLSSFVNIREGRVPLTLVLCLAVYIVPEAVDAFKGYDGVGHLAHIFGGLCGAGFGFLLSRKKADV